MKKRETGSDLPAELLLEEVLVVQTLRRILLVVGVDRLVVDGFVDEGHQLVAREIPLRVSLLGDVEPVIADICRQCTVLYAKPDDVLVDARFDELSRYVFHHDCRSFLSD